MQWPKDMFAISTLQSNTGWPERNMDLGRKGFWAFSKKVSVTRDNRNVWFGGGGDLLSPVQTVPSEGRLWSLGQRPGNLTDVICLQSSGAGTGGELGLLMVK